MSFVKHAALLALVVATDGCANNSLTIKATEALQLRFDESKSANARRQLAESKKTLEEKIREQEENVRTLRVIFFLRCFVLK